MTTHHIAVTVAQQGPDLWDAGVALGSAIVGAIAGALPAFLLAKRASKEVLERDQAQRREVEKALAFRSHVKLGTIINSIVVLKGHLDQSFADAIPGAEPWQMVQRLVGGDAERLLFFEADELAVFMMAGDSELSNELALFARRHAIHGEVLHEYNARREQLRQDMPPPEVVNGDRAQTAMTREQAMRLRPQMIELNSLIEQLVRFLPDDLRLGLSLTDRMTAACRRHFADESFPSFTILPEAWASAGLPEGGAATPHPSA